MGQGKTTVIAPLLALMIADGHQLVISIVPPHLLPSARAVLREKLAAALQRPVYGLSFDRYTPVTSSLLELLRHASALRGVLLTEPATIKSVMLKFVDALVEVRGEVSGADVREAAPSDEAQIMWRLQRLLGLRRRGRAKARRTRRQDLRVEAEVLASILGLFRRSVALLDEVDVLLHPLRSELNWPQGWARTQSAACTHARARAQPRHNFITKSTAPLRASAFGRCGGRAHRPTHSVPSHDRAPPRPPTDLGGLHPYSRPAGSATLSTSRRCAGSSPSTCSTARSTRRAV